jgi:hypothetical protein
VLGVVVAMEDRLNKLGWAVLGDVLGAEDGLEDVLGVVLGAEDGLELGWALGEALGDVVTFCCRTRLSLKRARLPDPPGS